MRKKKILRIVSVYLALNLLAQLFIPTAAYALTGGPSQPEVESFEPVGTTQMVDLFSGDFNYNIPLMTVPGPNGGYPINMAYHAGIGMEQEASWVGLGWNINPGEINRMMRGLPDDFKDAKVTKQLALKPNNTFSVEAFKPLDLGKKEYLGFKSGTFSCQLYFNNYKGVGMNLGVGLTSLEQNCNVDKMGYSFSLSLDPSTGLGVNPSFEYRKVGYNHSLLFHAGFGYSSHEGINSISLKASRERIKLNSNSDVYYATRMIANSKSAGTTFSSSSFVPQIDMPQLGMNIRVGFNFGAVNPAFSYNYRSLGGIAGSLSMQWNEHKPVDFDAYGYLYENSADAAAMHDMNREKDVPPTKDIPNMPVPVQTYDTYVIKGQGIGGVFRPYRNDVPVYSDPQLANNIPTVSYQQEIGTDATGTHLGMGMGVGNSESYSGPWQNLGSAITDHFQTTSASSNSLYEPVYFRVAGDISEGTPFATSFIDEEPVRFDLELAYNGISLKPKAINTLRSKSGVTQSETGVVQKSTREKRNEQIEYFTNGQIANMDDLYKNVNLPSFNLYPVDYGYASTSYDRDRSSDNAFDNAAFSNQLGAVSVLNPDGNRYIYALPAINKSQKEVVFSAKTFIDPADCPRTSTYDPTADENNDNNKEGYDHYFSSIKIPPYSHSFLLTAIVSPDYVDLTGNGLTNDDLGYFVKFNYSKINTYGWRIPYNDKEGNLNRQLISNPEFNKLSYTYGEKEIYYINSIETKTHIAEFTLNDDTSNPRQDALGASDEDNAAPSSRPHQRFLQQISLYSKNDIVQYHNAHPSDNLYQKLAIKTVNFEYNYSLCGNVDNNIGSNITSSGGTPSGDADNINLNKGKLTLKKVWFSYRGNTKGELSPYQFDYNEADNTTANAVNPENPDYSLAAMDRWGNYQKDNSTDKIFNTENPYVNQPDVNHNIQADLDRNAGVWSLKEITLPSGATIQINYEADNYAYVQDKPAMQMVKIIDLMNSSGTTSSLLKKENTRIHFALKSPISSSDPLASQKLHAYGKGMDKMYFKVFERLKRYYPTNNPTSPRAYGSYDNANDYVEGYARVKKDGNGDAQMGFVGTSPYNEAYIEVETEEINGSADLKHLHPFRKAGLQYVRLHRSDLTVPDNDFGGAAWNLAAVGPVYTAITGSLQMIMGYYNWAIANGNCNEIVEPVPNASDYYRPSFIRLNTPDQIKFGGGHRVKSIVMNDNWKSMVDGTTPAIGSNDPDSHELTSEYGQTYSYTMPDGTSSGVADYEPLIGGEEIPHHLPDPYSSNKFLANDQALFLEQPYCESFYPSASVGYRRVIVKNLDHTADGVTKNANGITVYEYYTSKDFPVKVDYTTADPKKYFLPVLIPFVGKLGFNNKGYSQGYSVELNDMAGKLKSVSTYSSHANLNDMTQQPVTKVEYIYKTKSPYNDVGPNYLDNTVKVLDSDANYRDATLGVTSDFYIDMRENYNNTFCYNLDPNIDMTALPSVVFTVAPTFEISEAMFRSAVTVKAFYKTGILVETKAYDNGSSVSTDNLMFDAQTGQPLLTSVTNDFNAPVYTYKYAAHWAYDGMGSAGENWGASFTFSSGVTSGIAAYPDPSNYFALGDELLHFDSGGTLEQREWVTEIHDVAGTSSDYIVLRRESGQLSGGYAGEVYQLVRSGRRNQQSITNGTIVSLQNPVTSRIFPLFEAFNTLLASTTPDPENSETTSLEVTDCVTGTVTNVTFDLTNSGTNQVLSFRSGIGEECKPQVILPGGTFASVADLAHLQFIKMGTTVKIIDTDNPTAPPIYGTWNDPELCYFECIPGVLHADAARFANHWLFNFGDAGDPSMKYQPDISNPSFSPMPLSDIAADATLAYHNPYRIGETGIWRTQSTFLYQVDRKKSSPQTDISQDGTYDHFVPYNWATTQQNNPRWSLVNRVTLYSPYGYELENVDTLGIYSSAMYGYKNSLATAVTTNARYLETGFDGFEDYGTSYPESGWGHGHLLFKTGSSTYPSNSTAFAHTGTHSLEIGTTAAEFTAPAAVTTYDPDQLTFTPFAGKEYYASFWVKHATDKTTGFTTAYVKVNGTTVSTVTTSKDDIIIEGWHQVTLRIPALTSGDILKIGAYSNDPSSGNIYLDDFRIQPFTSAIKTFVYDPSTLWLVAELDNQNFATFYNYDEEGSLVQVKKETTSGIITLRTSRSNIKH